MVVAMLPVLMVKPTVDEVIGVIAVRHRLVPAVRAMDMTIVALGVLPLCAALGVPVVHLNDMLVHMPVVGVVQMAIMQIVYMPLVVHCGVAAVRPVAVGMVTMRVML